MLIQSPDFFCFVLFIDIMAILPKVYCILSNGEKFLGLDFNGERKDGGDSQQWELKKERENIYVGTWK